MRVLVPNTFDMLSPQTLFRLSKVREEFPEATICAVIIDLAFYQEALGPVLNKEEEIRQSLEHCKYIDEVLGECPQIITKAFIKRHKGDAVVNIEESPDFIDFLKGAYELRIVKEINQKSSLASSDDLLVRIIHDMDKYIVRNLNRGYKRKELNVSWRKATLLKVKDTISSALFCSRRRKEE